ncbi:MAG: PIG-L deacetylase family protein [Fimbriimonas sp.]
MNVLVIAPHPDDEVLGCGGTIARHVAAGDVVRVLVMTRGSSDLFADELVNTVREECRQAHAVLGTHGVDFLDHPAPKLDTIPQYLLAANIASYIREHGSEVVYVPHRGDMHFEHRLIYNASLVACRPTPGTPVRKILAYETLSETDWAPPFPDDAFIPTVFVDVSAYMEKKIEAMACFKSQVKAPPASRSLDSLRGLATFRGSTVSVHAAEGFMLVREVAYGS